MWNSRPPPRPSWKKTLNFHFDYLHPSLRQKLKCKKMKILPYIEMKILPNTPNFVDRVGERLGDPRD